MRCILQQVKKDPRELCIVGMKRLKGLLCLVLTAFQLVNGFLVGDIRSLHIPVPKSKIFSVSIPGNAGRSQRKYQAPQNPLSSKALLLFKNAKSISSSFPLVSKNNKAMLLPSSEFYGVLDDLLLRNHQEWDILSISNAIYGLGVVDWDISTDIVLQSFLGLLASKLMEYKGRVGVVGLSKCLFGIRKLHPLVGDACDDLLQELTRRLYMCKERFDAQAVGNSLFALQHMDPGNPHVRSLMIALSHQLARCGDGSVILRGQEIGNALYGFQKMQHKFESCVQLLSSLNPLLVHSAASKGRTRLKSQELANAIYGLRGMSSDCIAVRRTLTALIPIIEASTFTSIKPNELGSLFYGFQQLSSDVVEVRVFLSAVLSKLEMAESVAPIKWDVAAVSQALFGLQRMSSDHAVVNRLVEFITRGIASLNHPSKKDGSRMSAAQIAAAYFGLGGLNGNLKQTQKLLTALLPYLQSCSDMFAGQELSCAMKGLRNMSDSVDAVASTVGVLAAHLERSKFIFTSHEISNCLIGLSNLSCRREEVKKFVVALTAKVRRLSERHHQADIDQAVSGLTQLKPDGEYEEERELFRALERHKLT